MDTGSDTRPAHAHNTSWSTIDRTYTQPGLLRSFVPLYSAGSQLCLQKALYFMTLTPPPKAKLSNKAPLQGPLGPCLPPRSSGSSVVGLEVSSGAQNPVRLFILKQPSSCKKRQNEVTMTQKDMMEAHCVVRVKLRVTPMKAAIPKHGEVQL